jgi:hypothetical protein
MLHDACLPHPVEWLSAPYRPSTVARAAPLLVGLQLHRGALIDVADEDCIDLLFHWASAPAMIGSLCPNVTASDLH